MSKVQTFRDMSPEELQAACLDKRKELFQLVNERKQAQQFEKPHRIKQTKKEIARVLTILREKTKG